MEIKLPRGGGGPASMQYVYIVGRSIADVYNRGTIFPKGQHVQINILTKVIYRGYGPTNYTTLHIYIHESHK